jgi:hypothetical protein
MFLKSIYEDKFPRIFISLTTHFHQKPSDKVFKCKTAQKTAQLCLMRFKMNLSHRIINRDNQEPQVQNIILHVQTACGSLNSKKYCIFWCIRHAFLPSKYDSKSLCVLYSKGCHTCQCRCTLNQPQSVNFGPLPA